MTATMLTNARAEALFLHRLHGGAPPTNPADTTAAIQATVRAFGGTHNCACRVAEEFGDHADTAPDRMTVARDIVTTMYGGHR